MKNKKEKSKITRDVFIEWIDNYSTVVAYHTSKTTTFLDILGWDGGDVTKTGLKDDRSVEFSKPETVDKWYKEVVEACREEYKGEKFDFPKVSFADFCKTKGLI